MSEGMIQVGGPCQWCGQQGIIDCCAMSRHADEAMERATKRHMVLSELFNRCHANDQKHGGPTHDDTHSCSDWLGFIGEWTYRGNTSLREGLASEYRSRLLDIAALAVAAIESYDRTTRR